MAYKPSKTMEFVVGGNPGRLSVFDKRDHVQINELGSFVFSIMWSDAAGAYEHSCDWHAGDKKLVWFTAVAPRKAGMPRWGNCAASDLPREFVSTCLLLLPQEFTS